MPVPGGQSCGTCLFYGPTGVVHGVLRGPCRVQPPEPLAVRTPAGQTVVAVFPMPRADEWCQEWVTK